jgi:hypothetical protein
MHLKVAHALELLRQDLARVNELLLADEPLAPLYVQLVERASTFGTLDYDWLFDEDRLPVAPEPAPDELAEALQAVWARADVTLARAAPARGRWRTG